MILKNKVAVIYGAGGAIGSAVARSFASEGAKVFLTGRVHTPVEAVAKEIVSAGGSAIAHTDRPHAYAAEGKKPARFTMVVAEWHAPRAPGGAGRRPRAPA